jgi:tetratricopeptide (TPR) repeat protein
MVDRSQTRNPRDVSAAQRDTLRSPQRPTFVGRDAEVEQLMRMFVAAEEGDAQLAILRGPAGIGKTRLAEEIGVIARGRGARVALGTCWPDGEAPPLWPWRGILRDLGAGEGLLDERPEAHGRFARFLAVLDYLQVVSRRTASLVIVDDAPLADPASLMLGRFLSRARDLRLLLVFTCRDETPASPEIVELLADLSRGAVSITLEGLPEDAVRRYLAAAGAAPTDPQLLRAVTAVTSGNPLHLRSVAVQSELRAGLQGGLERAIGDLLETLDDADRRLIALSALMGAEASVHEVARVAGTSPTAVAESLGRAVRAGLASELASGRFGFVHDLVRQRALAALPLADRLEAHARTAALLTGGESARMSRRAHHALSAAGRSREDAEAAVGAARDAALALRAEGGFEAAAALLGRATEIHAEAALQSSMAGLALERAESVLACGRLAAARPLFQHAARAAEREGDPVVRARAAIGLGGLWVSEHRLADEAERILALQRRALEGLPPEEVVLRARLTVRLAAEDASQGGPVAPVFEAVEAARQTGDAHALAEALSLAHHVLPIPEQTERRLSLAGELIAAAASAGDGLLSLVGLCWQAADLFLLGHPGARAALEELRLRADALRCLSILFIVRGMEVMLAIRAGEFAQAEEAAAACFALGTEVGDADALAYHGAHLCAIRAFQGREAEVADLAAKVAASPTLVEGREERTFVYAAALFSLRAGRPQQARAVLEQLRRDGLASLPPASSWLATMLAVVELAHDLEDRGIAQAAYDALLPYADLPLMGSLAVVCFGSVHRCLGVAALTCGKLDLAIEHFAAALAANEQLGHRPAAIQAQAELSLARSRRAAKGHEPRARALLQQAMAEGEATGMSGLVARWRQAAASAEPRATPDEPDAALIAEVRGGKWRVVLKDKVATVPDRVGMRYLARLLAAPDRSIPALALVIDGSAEPEHNPDPLMDRKAIAAVRDRIRELEEKRKPSAADRDELEALTRELARSTGLGGRVRSFADAPERARTAVRKAIKRAIVEISAANPTVGQHLARHVETGTVCCYRLESLAGGTPT